MPFWVAATKTLGTAGKGVKGVAAKTGKGAKKGLQRGAKKSANATRKGAQQAGRKAGQAGRSRMDPRTARNRRDLGGGAGRSGSGGSSGPGRSGGSGSGGSGVVGGSGRGGPGRRKGGWGQRAKDLATPAGGASGGRGLADLGGGGGSGSEGVGDAAADGTDAARRFIANRWRRRRGPLKKTRTRLSRICTIILLMLLGYPLVLGTIGSDAASQQTEAVMAMQCSGAPPQLMHEQTEIPIEALQAYCSAAVHWRVDWAILAAIGSFECSHWQNKRDPGCDPGPPHTVNDKGARGPMQFLGSTWRSSAGAKDIDVAGPPIPEGQENLGFATDSEDADSIADPWSWRDATHAAARKLRHDGVEEDPRRALLRYNPSDDYADGVLRLAEEYRSKVERVMDEQAGAGGGGPASGDCSWHAEGSTDPIPARHNTETLQITANTLIECFGRNNGDVGCYAEREKDLYEHPRGRACDFMMSSGVASGHQRDRGLAMAEWAQAHADELNILYVIWYNRIWSRSRDPAGPRAWSTWRSYGCGGCGATRGHFDHVHVSVKLMPGDPSWARCTHDGCTD
jgi:hypothetical protein